MKNLLPLVAVATMAASTAAIAQTNDLIEIQSDDQMVEEYQMTVDQLDDMDLYNTAGERLGEIEDVLGTRDGRPTAFSVDVGGFLGIGETDVVVPFEEVTLTDSQLTVDMTKEQVELLDRWED